MIKNLIGTESSVLVVDDEIELLENLKEILTPHFSAVHTASNGKDAIKILQTQTVHAVVTDFYMPTMNGAELVNYMQKAYPLIPVLFLTSHVSDPIVVQLIKTGAFDVLEKPIDCDILINRILNSLLMPQLVKVLWAALSREFSPPKIEDFLTMPLEKQLQTLHAFAGLLKARSLIGMKTSSTSNDDGDT